MILKGKRGAEKGVPNSVIKIKNDRPDIFENEASACVARSKSCYILNKFYYQQTEDNNKIHSQLRKRIVSVIMNDPNFKHNCINRIMVDITLADSENLIRREKKVQYGDVDVTVALKRYIDVRNEYLIDIIQHFNNLIQSCILESELELKTRPV